MKYVVISVFTIIIGWTLGFAYGKEYWGKKYDWIIGDLHLDIDNYRSVLNDPHHCVSVCLEQFEKMGC